VRRGGRRVQGSLVRSARRLAPRAALERARLGRRQALARALAALTSIEPHAVVGTPLRLSFVVDAAHAIAAQRALHAAFVG
jgi:hypothetical protein